MRNTRWLRYGLALVTLTGASLGTFLVACGDDENTGPAGKTDSGTDGSSSDSSTDSSTDGPAPGVDAGQPAKIVLVHAATDLGASAPSGGLRVCFATATKDAPNDFAVTPFPILPHTVDTTTAAPAPFPGIFIGTGGIFPSSGADLEEVAVRPYVMNAERLAGRGIIGNAPTTPRCKQVLTNGFVPDGGWPDGGSEPLANNVDYWQLSDIPIGTLKKNHSYMLMITGCTNDSDPQSVCGAGDNGQPFNPAGPGNPGAGNLKILVLELDDATSVAADEIGVQVVHASPQYDLGVGQVVPPLSPSIGTFQADGGAASVALAAPNDSDGGAPGLRFNRTVTKPTALAKIKGVVTASGFFASHPDGANGQPVIAIPLNNAGVPAPGTPNVQLLTTGKLDAAQLYVNGKSYTFVAVGDINPAAQGARKYHYLGFPNQFTPPPLQ